MPLFSSVFSHTKTFTYRISHFALIMTITGVIAIPINNNVYAQAQKDAVE